MTLLEFSKVDSHQVLELDQLYNETKSSHIFDYILKSICGRGTIRFLKLGNGFDVLEIDTFLRQPFKLSLNNKNKNYIYFIYCTEGSVYHKFKNQKKFTHIEELCPSLFGSIPNTTSSLLLKPSKPSRLSILCIDKTTRFEEFKQYPTNNCDLSKTESILNWLDQLEDQLYSCTKSLKLAESLYSIKPFEINDDLLDILDIKGNYQKALALFMNTFYTELFNTTQNTSLKTNELQSVRKISEFIIENLDEQHDIKSLCRKAGLSPVKLQEGFKHMHGTTVSDYIRSKRLDYAEQLFLTTDLNVSEVVYKIGIMSRSYFCKIFKLKFGCSPSTFRKRKNK